MLIYINTGQFVFKETLGAGKNLFDLSTICEMYDVPWLADVATII